MAVNFPDELKHNNDNYSIVDNTNVRGGPFVVSSVAARDAIPINKRKSASIVTVETIPGISYTEYKYRGSNTSDGNWTNPSNWIVSDDITNNASNNEILFSQNSTTIDGVSSFTWDGSDLDYDKNYLTYSGTNHLNLSIGASTVENRLKFSHQGNASGYSSFNVNLSGGENGLLATGLLYGLLNTTGYFAFKEIIIEMTLTSATVIEDMFCRVHRSEVPTPWTPTAILSSQETLGAPSVGGTTYGVILKDVSTSNIRHDSDDITNQNSVIALELGISGPATAGTVSVSNVTIRTIYNYYTL